MSLFHTEVGMQVMRRFAATLFVGRRLVVFARRAGSSPLVNRRVNGGWTGSKSLGGGIVGSPSAVSDGHLHSSRSTTTST